jgi:hypothetical protein
MFAVYRSSFRSLLWRVGNNLGNITGNVTESMRQDAMNVNRQLFESRTEMGSGRMDFIGDKESHAKAQRRQVKKPLRFCVFA